MSNSHKIFLALFVIFTAINIYAINWNIGAFHTDNLTYIYSACSGVLGILATFIFSTIRGISRKS